MTWRRGRRAGGNRKGMGDRPNADGPERGDGDDADLTAGSERLGDDLPSATPRFEEYEVLDQVGEGSFGVVYRCRARGGRRLVAIKVPKRSTAAIAVFESELELLERLPEHPHVVRVVGAARADLGGGRSLPALVMSWIPNARPLDAYCDHHRLGRTERLALLRQVATGLRHLHDHAVLHLDLKPRNVLVGDDGVPVIVDLGGARCRIGMGSPPSVLTIAYASPEQLEGAEPESLEQRSDVYSFGRLMGTILLGGEVNALPRDRSRAELVERMIAWSPDEYRRHPMWRDGAVGSLMLAALRRRPDERPTIHHVADELSSLVRPTAYRAAAALAGVLRHHALHATLALQAATLLGSVFAVLLAVQYVRHPIGPPLRFPARAPSSLDDVVIVEITDDEVMARAVTALGIDRAATNVRDQRRHVLAAIIRAADRGRAAMTTLDAEVPVAPEAEGGTKAIAEAVMAASGRMPVVFGINKGWMTDPGPATLDPRLAPYAGGTGSFDFLGHETAAATGLIHIPIAVERPGRSTAWSLSAAAVAALHGGPARVLHPSGLAQLRSVEFLGSWSSERTPPFRRCQLDQSFEFVPGQQPTLSAGPRAGDDVTVLTLDATAIGPLCADRHIAVDRFLALDEPGLLALVRGKVVLGWIGNIVDPTTKSDDRWDLGGPTKIPGGWIQAAAIQALLTLPDHAPSSEALTGIMVSLAAAGSIVGMRVGRGLFLRPRRTWTLLGVVYAAGLVTVVVLAGAASASSPHPGWDFRIVVPLLAVAISLPVAAVLRLLRLALRFHQ